MVDIEQVRLHAAEARQLRDNPAFQRAVTSARQRLLEQLLEVDPRDPEALRKIQANVHAIDMLAEMIADEMIRGMSRRDIGIVANG